MSIQTTIARPYAKAVFQLATEQGALAHWSDQLSCIGCITAHESVQWMVSAPDVSPEQLIDLLLTVAGDQLDPQGVALVKVLVRNRRLQLMPEVIELYERRRAEAEGVHRVSVQTAVALSEKDSEAITQALSTRFGGRVELQVTVDQSLLGGALVRIGDLVIDGSLSGRLAHLTQALCGR